MTTSAKTPGPLVLVLDDEARIRGAAARILGLHNYRVLTAGTAHEALGLMKEHEGAVDLLLCDLVLPGLSGREAASLLLAQNPDLKVLFMSGYSSHGSGRRDVQEAGHAFLGKPLKVNELVEAVETALRS